MRIRSAVLLGFATLLFACAEQPTGYPPSYSSSDGPEYATPASPAYGYAPGYPALNNYGSDVFLGGGGYWAGGENRIAPGITDAGIAKGTDRSCYDTKTKHRREPKPGNSFSSRRPQFRPLKLRLPCSSSNRGRQRKPPRPKLCGSGRKLCNNCISRGPKRWQRNSRPSRPLKLRPPYSNSSRGRQLRPPRPKLCSSGRKLC